MKKKYTFILSLIILTVVCQAQKSELALKLVEGKEYNLLLHKEK